MHGLMMEVPLTITSIMRHAERHHPRREIVSVTSENPRHRYRYADAFARARKLARALRRGLKDGERVATLAWNDYRHFEIYYAVSCSGLVCSRHLPDHLKMQQRTVRRVLAPEQLFAIEDR